MIDELEKIADLMIGLHYWNLSPCELDIFNFLREKGLLTTNDDDTVVRM